MAFRPRYANNLQPVNLQPVNLGLSATLREQPNNLQITNYERTITINGIKRSNRTASCCPFISS
ncbi:MAG: hypothetical protein F6K56_32810 [Moorea sp. SIO3G5]|nr:hypothetical protein [Moorena sp. SIO3G5]